MARVARWTVFPLLLLLGAAGAVALLRGGAAWLPYLVGGALALAWLAWTVASTLSPSVKPDRRCPRCREEALEPLRRGSPLGVRCARCGWRDETGHVPNILER